MANFMSGAAGAALVGGVFGLITWALNHRAAKKDKSAEKTDNLTCGTRMLLYIVIKDRARHYIHEGSITPEDLEDILAMHVIYHDKLGGNGFLDSVIKQVRQLPIRD
jgi:hypothetical protein